MTDSSQTRKVEQRLSTGGRRDNSQTNSRQTGSSQTKKINIRLAQHQAHSRLTADRQEADIQQFTDREKLHADLAQAADRQTEDKTGSL